MEFTMNWEAIGAVGELVSAIAVLATLIYLAVQVRHSKILLERNEKIALSQVHQARATARIHHHIAQFESDYYTTEIAALSENPAAVDALSEEQRVRARAMYLSTVVMQDNALYQGELGLLDADTVRSSKNMVIRSYALWKKLEVPLTPRIEVCYEAWDGGVA